jgi:hypothetical protein
MAFILTILCGALLRGQKSMRGMAQIVAIIGALET